MISVWRNSRFWSLGLGLILGGSGQLFAFFLIVFNFNVALGLQQHIVASLLLALAYRELMPRHYRLERWRTVFLLWSVFLFFPLIGLVGVLISLLLPAYFTKPKAVVDVSNVVTELPMLPDCALLAEPMAQKEDTVVSKKQMLMRMASQRLESKESIAVIRQELCNPVDEVRLLAYSLIDRKAQAFNERITATLKQLEAVMLEDKIRLYEQLAYDHWELVYLGLAQGSVIERLLIMARKYAVLALAQTCAQNRSSLCLLLARIALRMEDRPAAAACLRRAEEQGMSKVRLLLYWQEVAFLEGMPSSRQSAS